MTQKIGPREQALREMRERQFTDRKPVAKLREAVAAIPAKKIKAKKKRA